MGLCHGVDVKEHPEDGLMTKSAHIVGELILLEWLITDVDEAKRGPQACDTNEPGPVSSK